MVRSCHRRLARLRWTPNCWRDALGADPGRSHLMKPDWQYRRWYGNQGDHRWGPWQDCSQEEAGRLSDLPGHEVRWLKGARGAWKLVPVEPTPEMVQALSVLPEPVPD